VHHSRPRDKGDSYVSARWTTWQTHALRKSWLSWCCYSMPVQMCFGGRQIVALCGSAKTTRCCLSTRYHCSDVGNFAECALRPCRKKILYLFYLLLVDDIYDYPSIYSMCLVWLALSTDGHLYLKSVRQVMLRFNCIQTHRVGLRDMLRTNAICLRHSYSVRRRKLLTLRSVCTCEIL